MTRRLQTTPWYHRWFGSDYAKLYQHRSAHEARETVAWLLRILELPRPCRVLDLACGSGRHGVEFARQGFAIVGLDLSWPLLRAASRLDAHGRFKRIRGDMRHPPFRAQSFGLVLSLFTSFGYFASTQDDARVLTEAARLLRPGGILVLDFLNAALVRRDIIPEEETNLGGIQVSIRRWVDEAENRVNKQITLCDAGQNRQYLESVYLYSESELADLFRLAGLGLQAEYGDYFGAPFTSGSPRLIMIGRHGAQ